MPNPKPLASLVTLFSTFGAVAQCDLEWIGGGAVAGTEGAVLCTESWDPDGAGPLPVHAVLGGGFRLAGGLSANGIAAWNPVTGTWRVFGSGLLTPTSGSVRDVTTDATGRLVAAGTLYANGIAPSTGVAVFTGASWTPLQSGTGLTLTSARSVLRTNSGDLFACATWLDANQVQRNGVARWNGTSWSVVGSGPFGTPGSFPVLLDLCELPNGDVVVAGRFDAAAGVPADGVARWDGTSWSAVGTGLSNGAGTIESIDVLPNGDLVAGGHLRAALGCPADGVAVWNGAFWTQLGAGLFATTGVIVQEVDVLPNGDVIACGAFRQSGATPVVGIARFDGTAWNPLQNGVAAGFGEICDTSHLLPDGRLLAAGAMSTASGVAIQNVALWNGSTWSAMPAVPANPGLGGTPYASRFGPGGALAIGGSFHNVGNVLASNVAVRNGSTWSALGSGVDGAVRTVVWLPNGDLVVGGSFNSAGGVFADGVARWNGTSWSAMGLGLGEVYALCVAPDGELYAGTDAGILGAGVRHWNGTTWGQNGVGLPGTTVIALEAMPNGDLIASSFSGGGAAPSTFFLSRHSSGAWSAFGTPLAGQVNAILPLPDGDVVVGGTFSFASGGPANRVAKWTNNAWSAVGTGFDSNVNTLALLPDGDLIAGGQFTTAGAVAASRIARFDGSWNAIGRGCSDTVLTTAFGADELLVGGFFTTAGDYVAFGIASLESPCPASANTLGSGCTGVSGPMTLTSSQLPWIGSTYRSTSTGFGPDTFGVWEIGTTQLGVLVSSLLPEGGAGCMQWTSLDVRAELVFPTGNRASGSVFVPASTALIGGVVFNQMAQVEVDPVSGAIVRIATSNALTMTVGAF